MCVRRQIVGRFGTFTQTTPVAGGAILAFIAGAVNVGWAMRRLSRLWL